MICIKEFEIENPGQESILGQELIASEYLDQPRPLVIFYHGWSASGNAHIHFGLEIARKGFRVIVPDARFHGRRNLHKKLKPDAVYQAIKSNILEYPLIIERYKPLIKDNFIGVSGMSMGGMTSCLLLANHPEISAGVCLMGAPDFKDFGQASLAAKIKELHMSPEQAQEVWQQFDLAYDQMRPYDLSQNPQAINSRPVFFWHGQDDKIVPIKFSQDFIERNKDLSEHDYVYYVTEPGGHRVPFYQIMRMAIFFEACYKLPKDQIWSHTQKEIEEKQYRF